MVKGNLDLKIGNTDTHIITVPNVQRFSFSNSPYYAHQGNNAIDIYPKSRKTFVQFGDEVVSPVSGKLITIKKFKPPSKNYIDTTHDYLLGIQLEENEKLIARILHIKPLQSLGSYIQTGEQLGSLVRSRFFSRWTEPHYHLEVRRTHSNITRAKGGLPLSLKSKSDNNQNRFGISKHDYFVNLINTTSEYLVGEPPRDIISRLYGWYGFTVTIGSKRGIIDAGLPYYKHGGLIHDELEYKAGEHVLLGNTPIGTIANDSSNLFYTTKKLRISLNHEPLRGVSFFIYRNKPVLKLILNKDQRVNEELIGIPKIRLTFAE